MTLERLNQHFELLRRREETEELLENLRSRAKPKTSSLTGMPRAPGVRDPVGELAAEMADCQAELDSLAELIQEDEGEIAAFIRSFPDLKMRTIFRLRFLRGLAWCEVADVVRQSEAAVKAIAYRYIRHEERTDENADFA